MDLDYQYVNRFQGIGLFNETIDYRITVPCINIEKSLEYIYRLYKFGSYIYITDIFPEIFANDTKCFQRLTSHEGFSINMRKLSITCLKIFITEFINNNNVNNVMVISGSYEINETANGPSRKLRLYWYFFYPLFERYELIAINLFDKNAFLIYSKHSTLNSETIINDYLEFKKKQNNDRF